MLEVYYRICDQKSFTVAQADQTQGLANIRPRRAASPSVANFLLGCSHSFQSTHELLTGRLATNFMDAIFCNNILIRSPCEFKEFGMIASTAMRFVQNQPVRSTKRFPSLSAGNTWYTRHTVWKITWVFSLPIASIQNKNAKSAWAFIQVVGPLPGHFFAY